MIPNIEILTKEITEKVYPSRTYKINFDSVKPPVINSTAVLGIAKLGIMKLGVAKYTSNDNAETVHRINGYIDGLDALKQAIYLILSTERYQYIIYSWDYGVELIDLIGQPISYVMAEVPRRITEALTQDDRISDVTNFEFERNGKRLNVTFTVVSNLGNIPTELEVDI